MFNFIKRRRDKKAAEKLLQLMSIEELERIAQAARKDMEDSDAH